MEEAWGRKIDGGEAMKGALYQKGLSVAGLLGPVLPA